MSTTPDIVPAETETGAPIPDVSQAPAEKDAYFKKADGTPVTGLVRGPDGKFQKAEGSEATEAKADEKPAEAPAKAKPEEPAKKTEDEKRQQSIGDAWREVKEAKRSAASARAQAEAAIAEATKLRESLEAEAKEMRGNFRGWIAKQNLSLRELIEEDLKEQDADPRDKTLRELRAELDALKAERDEEKQAKGKQTEELSIAQEREQIGGYLAEKAEEFPYIAAYGAETAAREIQSAFYAHLKETGEHLDVFAMFDQAESILADNAARLAAVKQGHGSQTTEVSAQAAGAQSSDGKRVAEEPGERIQTLTNRSAAQTASGARPQTREERLAAAASRLQLR
jgi:hypothetical protein